MNALVAYFSAESGRTASVAKTIASSVGADLFEIKPQKPYSASDLNYMNPLARCNREHIAKKDVPIESAVKNFDNYDTVLIGFPMWYYGAPNIIKTFCKAYDFSSKKVALFVTSGGSPIGKTAQKLQPYINEAEIIDAKLMNGVSQNNMREWVEGL